MTSNRRNEKKGQIILNFFESIKGNCRKVVIQGVRSTSVIWFKRYKRNGADTGRIFVKGRANFA